MTDMTDPNETILPIAEDPNASNKWGKNAYNERQKYLAAALDRLGTAFFIAGLVASQTRLDGMGLEFGVPPEWAGVVTGFIWILSGLVLHCTGYVALKRIQG